MDVRKAAQTAKDYLTKIFADEQITHVGLEEVEFDNFSESWKITIGFFRPWERPAGSVLETAFGGLPAYGKRSFKVVRIRDEDGEVTSITDRFLEASN